MKDQEFDFEGYIQQAPEELKKQFAAVHMAAARKKQVENKVEQLKRQMDALAKDDQDAHFAYMEEWKKFEEMMLKEASNEGK